MLRQIWRKFRAIRSLSPAITGVVIFIIVAGCHNDKDSGFNEGSSEKTVSLTFELVLNPLVYQNSAWGDPPQIAIWLRNQADQSIRTVTVTYRTAACDWIGKIECSVALPYWVTFYNKQTQTKGPPTWDSPLPDAVTCATPKAELIKGIEVSGGTRWEYFIEVNVSGDFNLNFPRFSSDGVSDTYGNGQPSLVYHGWIDSAKGSITQPQLLGRTDQYAPVDNIINDMEGITTAAKLLNKIYVSCRVKQ
ncbi:MAG: hypothetical protein A2173_06220 [Planctomycetes bacterium RBG_13_44_8b]|nr:MAG: hypothetical protein A2173_06220 [Planctomycetes bacterium RBG_13_44_8b]